MKYGCFDVKTFNKLEPNIRMIRKIVFEDEQGFIDEFDEIDNSDTVVHMLLCKDDEPIAEIIKELEK